MDNMEIKPEETQADFIRKDLNFNTDSEEPQTKEVIDHHKGECDIFGNGQLKKKVIKEGQDGTRPIRHMFCNLKIIGKLKDGTIVEKYEDILIQLGDVEVVQGLDLAIGLMNVGEIAEVEVAPRFAYGSLGKEPNIPPDSTIWYEVELKSSELCDLETANVNRRRELGNNKKVRGNWWFARDEPTLAILCYRRALDLLFLPKVTSNLSEGIEESTSDTELQALLEDRMKVYNNLAAAQIKTQAYDAALESVDNVLRCQPQNVKALFRKGRILHLKGEHSLAYTTLLHAAKLEPETKAIQQELAIIKEKNLRDAQHEKNLYRKMLGTHKTNNTATKNAKNKEKSKLSNKFAWSLVGGAVATVAGILVFRLLS